MLNPTPKIRTKYLDQKTSINADSEECSKGTLNEEESSLKSTTNIINEANLTWKRRSIKKANCESEEDEPGKRQ